MSPVESWTRCRKCRSVCIGEHKFCIWCGASLAARRRSLPKPAYEHEAGMDLIGALIILIVMAALGAVGLWLATRILAGKNLAPWVVLYIAIAAFGAWSQLQRPSGAPSDFTPGARFALGTGVFSIAIVILIGGVMLVSAVVLFFTTCKF